MNDNEQVYINARIVLNTMWNRLWKTEDKLEESFKNDPHVGISRWISELRPWLQRGFDLAVDVVGKEREENGIQVIRCKDCKYCSIESDKLCWFGRRKQTDSEDWFCADGKMR